MVMGCDAIAPKLFLCYDGRDKTPHWQANWNMVIDFHTHAFAERIAGKAIQNLKRSSGNIEPAFDGTIGGLRRYLEENAIDRAVVMNIATNPAQQHNVNNFAIQENHGRLVCFGSVHPDAPDALEELHRIREAGLKGIKLHPDYQHFYVDEDRMLPIYETAGKLGLIVCFHSGVDIGFYEPVHCTPERLSRMLDVFRAPVIAAHMGAYQQWYDVEDYLVGKKVLFDTAFCYGCMPRGHAQKIIAAHGAGNILFGSDMPWSSTVHNMDFIKSLELSPADEAAILGGNAARLLG